MGFRDSGFWVLCRFGFGVLGCWGLGLWVLGRFGFGVLGVGLRALGLRDVWGMGCSV